MATFFPLILQSGSITVANKTSILNFMNFPVTKLYAPSSAFATNLPDPYYFQTSSVEVSNSDTATSSSVFQFNPQGTPERQYYTVNSILGVKSTNASSGIRVGMSTINTQDRSIVVKVASTLTAFTYACQGTDDAFAFALPTTVPLTNTIYPANIQGAVFLLSGSLYNTVLIQPSAAITTVTAATGSLFYNQFIGYSSSLSTITSSVKPLFLSQSGTAATMIGTIGIGDTVTQSVLPPTASLWGNSALTTAVTSTSNAVWSDIFSLAGLTSGTKYLVNFYLDARSAATTTGVQIRFLSGSLACRGTIYTPVSSTAYAIQNSADGVSIINSATAWPVANAKALIWGEFTFTKSNAVATPALQVQTEVNASAVTIETGSIIIYRALQ